MVYDSFLNDVFDSFFDNSFPVLFGSNYKSPKVVKSITNNAFPQSNIYINQVTKDQKITVCLPGISADEVRLDRNDNVIELNISRKKDQNEEDWVSIQSGFTYPKHCTLSWKIDPAKYDLDTISVNLENGVMEINIHPTEAAKPKRISGLFGSLVDSKKDDVAEAEAETDASEVADVD